MAFGPGGGSPDEIKGDINVTPLVDVCLVLLIIFMVVTPMLQSGVDVLVPSEINITPLVDVVLVLLIIFMVATPILQMGLDIEVPPKVEIAGQPPPSELTQLVITIKRDGMYLNAQRVASPHDLANLIGAQ